MWVRTDQDQKDQSQALIFSGGARSVYEPGAPAVDPRLYRIGSWFSFLTNFHPGL